MTIKDLFISTTLPRNEAELLISFILNKTREFIIIHPEFEISKLQNTQFKRLEKKRLNHYPIAYLTGHKEFYGLDFKVDKNVLVPRPETEMMVEKILSSINKTKYNIIDLGTGSGAIIVTLAKELKKSNPSVYKKSNFFGIDVSEKALKIAQENSKINHINGISFLKSNLLNEVSSSELIGQDLIIAANLPYLTPMQVKQEKSISQEPRLALVAGSDGLKYYRFLIKYLSKIKFKSLYLILEIDPAQTKELKVLFCNAWKIRPEIVKDLRKENRFAIIKI